MYKNPETKEEEYPKTPREVLHYSLEILAKQFPERTVKVPEDDLGVPVYEWPSAGSERGGSAEHLTYERIVFLPAGKETLAVSVGDKLEGWDRHGVGMVFHDQYGAVPIDREYSVLLMERISPDAVEKILKYYTEHSTGKEEQKKDYSFFFTMHNLLKEGTRYFWRLPLFAYDLDSSGEIDGFFVKSSRFEPDRTRLLKRVACSWNAETIAGFIAKYAQEKAQETPFASFARKGFDKLNESEVERILKRLEKV